MAASGIPTVDYSLSTLPSTKPQFLSQLRDALVRVGSFYLKKHPVPECLQRDLFAQSRDMFQLSPEAKQAIEMASSKYFVGYVDMEDAMTMSIHDQRESYTKPLHRNQMSPYIATCVVPILCVLLAHIASDLCCRADRVWSQWLDSSALPSFRPVMEQYMAELRRLAEEFQVFVAEALDMKPDALAHLFDGTPFDRLMLAKYTLPSSPENAADNQAIQGKGRHKDSSFLTFFLPGTPHRGLEALSQTNEWIEVPFVPGALIVNVGMQLEALTDGVCFAALHRVLIRPEHFVDGDGNDLGPRFAFPLFNTISLDANQLEPLEMPPHICAMVRDDTARRNARVSLRRLCQTGCAGYGVFATRLKGYRKVTHRWWPQYSDLLTPDKMPQLTMALCSGAQVTSDH